MTIPNADNQTTATDKSNDKELNFRNLEQKYQKRLDEVEKERQREQQQRLELEKKLQERHQSNEDDDDDSDPYVDKKKLEKKLAKFGEQTHKQTQTEIQKAVNLALQEERRQNWLKNNGDFEEVLQHANKLAARDPDLAESILDMPESFERQKLVYKNIKALGLHKPEETKSSIQDKVNSNRRNGSYQPGNVGSSPYSSQGDFSKSGQKNAYEEMKRLIQNVRL